jgi:hypothetical protein
LEEASAFVEQASIQQLSPEARCLSSAAKRLEADPLQQAIALYKTLTADQQREFCRVIGLEMPEAALAKC